MVLYIAQLSLEIQNLQKLNIIHFLKAFLPDMTRDYFFELHFFYPHH